MKQETRYDEYELDFRELILTLWGYKWFIIGLCILAVLLAGIYSQYMMKPQYQARSTLLILPPTYTSSLEISTFPVETYKNLAMTQSMKSQIIEKLDLKHDNGQQYSPSDLDSMLGIEVQAQPRGEDDNLKAPLLLLKVTGSDPGLISNIANTWADIFMNDTRQIRKSEVQEIAGVIQNQFDDTKQKLLNTKQQLREFREQNRLELVKDELNIKKKHLSNNKDELMSLKSKLGSEKATYQQLQENIDKLEKNSKWAGVLNVNISDDSNSLLTKTKQNYLESQNFLLEFKENHDIVLLKQKIEIITEELKSYLKKINSLKSILEDKRIEVQKISYLINNEPERWNLKKALSEEVFWEKILTLDEIDILQDLQLNVEIINPIYQKLKTRLSDSIILVESIPEQIGNYQDLAVKRKNEIDELNNELDEWSQQLNRLKKDISNYEILYESQAGTYQELKNKFVQSELKIRSLSSQLAFYNQKVISLEQEVKNMQDFVWKNEIDQQQLTQQINNIQMTYNNLAQKVEEARLTEAQKTSDVKFIAQSVPPTKSIGPNKKLNVAIAGVLTLILSVFVIFFIEFMKGEE